MASGASSGVGAMPMLLRSAVRQSNAKRLSRERNPRIKKMIFFIRHQIIETELARQRRIYGLLIHSFKKRQKTKNPALEAGF
jgi:hypothetical protein